MKIQKLRPNNLRYLVFLAAVFTLIYCGISLNSYLTNTTTALAQTIKESKRQKTKGSNTNIQTFNNIDGLQITASEITESKFVITVKNNTEKVINSFYLSTGEFNYHLELIYSDVQDGIAPSASYKLPVDLDKNLYSYGLTINAILFEDGTGRGEAAFVQEMKDKRYGEKLELKNGIKLLENLSRSSDAEPLTKLEELKQGISSFSSNDKHKEKEAVKFGMNLGKQRLLRYIEELSRTTANNNLINFQTEITTLKNKLDKFISKQ